LHVRARLLVVFAAVCFSTTGTAQELGPNDASPIAVAVTRTIIGALALLALARATPAPAAPATVARRHWFLAGAGMAGYALAFFAAVRVTGVAIGTVVALGSAPLFAGALGSLLWRLLPDRRWMITTACAISGVAMIVTQGDDGAVDVRGVGLAMVAGLSYAVFALASKIIVDAQPSGARAMARVFAVAALLLLPALAVVDLGWIMTPSGATMALWLGVVTVAIAYWAYATGLRHLQPSDTTAITLVEPVVATLLAATVLGERPSTIAWFGVAIVIVSLALGGGREKTTSTTAVQH
jgi:DME family drug/metabolite transporter